MIRILAISGSLRRASSNTALLKAAASLAPSNVEIALYEGLDSLPHFNPDLEGSEPETVLDFLARLKACDGIMIASPEYAHGVTGVLKNALDWVVSSSVFVDKPVALLNGSPRATHAQEALQETVRMMMARIIPEASLVVPLPNNKIDRNGILANPELSGILQSAVLALVREIEISTDNNYVKLN